MKHDDVWKELRRMAGRPDGFSTSEAVTALGYERQKIGRACQSLVHRGELFTLRISHKYSRYFAGQEQLKVYEVKLNRNMTRSLRVMHTPFKNYGVKADWGPDTKTITPKHVKVQVGPSHPPRNTVHEFAFVHTRKGL